MTAPGAPGVPSGWRPVLTAYGDDYPQPRWSLTCELLGVRLELSEPLAAATVTFCAALRSAALDVRPAGVGGPEVAAAAWVLAHATPELISGLLVDPADEHKAAEEDARTARRYGEELHASSERSSAR